jgi:hypothetical protein
MTKEMDEVERSKRLRIETVRQHIAFIEMLNMQDPLFVRQCQDTISRQRRHISNRPTAGQTMFLVR